MPAVTAVAPAPAWPAPPSNPYAHLEGIGGWLILIAVNLAIAPLLIARNAMQTDAHLIQSHGPGAVSGILLLLKNLISIVALLALNWLFYNHKRIFPPARIGYLCWVVCTQLIHSVLAASARPQSHTLVFVIYLFGPLLAASIWIPYLLISCRVKVTFVE